MTIGDDALALPPRPYIEVRGEIRDGDLLMCSAHDFGSRLIRWATRSVWSHCAIAFRMPDIDRVMCLECVERLGVRAVPLSDFVRRTSSGIEPYPGRIVLARHPAIAARDGATPMKAMSGFAFDRLGRAFSRREVAKIGLRILLGRFDIRLPGAVAADDEYICSEYVARCFEQVGIAIPWDGLGFVAPGDFALDPAITAVARIAT